MAATTSTMRRCSSSVRKGWRKTTSDIGDVQNTPPQNGAFNAQTSIGGVFWMSPFPDAQPARRRDGDIQSIPRRAHLVWTAAFGAEYSDRPLRYAVTTSLRFR